MCTVSKTCYAANRKLQGNMGRNCSMQLKMPNYFCWANVREKNYDTAATKIALVWMTNKTQASPAILRLARGELGSSYKDEISESALKRVGSGI